MIKCPNCTGELNFDVKNEVVKCEYCGSTFNPQELQARVKMSGEEKESKKSKETFEGKSFTCSQCGAVLMTFDETAITFCSYCGSQAMIESKMMKQNNPDYIIPFKKTKEECIENYKKKVSKSFFAPKKMKSDAVVEKFRGIYIPYSIYKLEHHGPTKNKGSKYSHRSGDYQIYDDYEIDADVDASYDGISFDLISKFYDKFSMAIPYNYKEKIEFNPNYLIGFYADTKDVDESVYNQTAKNLVKADSTVKMSKEKEFGKKGCHNPVVEMEVTDNKIGMFPVYFLAIRDKSDKNVHYAVVNGQTGEVALDLPIDFKKYLLVSILIALGIFIGIDNFLVLTPKIVCFISIIFGIISLIISSSQVNQIRNRMTHADDKGYTSLQEKTKKKEKSPVKLFRYIYKELIAIIIPALVLISGTIEDSIIYTSAAIGLGFVVLSFGDLIKEHNLLSSNKLPQLEKRGGDEND